MADWFRFYDNAMTEPRFQYALRKCPWVLHAWVWTLSECCRMKSDTVILRGDMDLIGASAILAIDLDQLKQGLETLSEIKYVENGGNALKVLKWKDLQSEYCKRKVRVSEQSTDNDSTMTPERRGEESIYTRAFATFWDSYPRKKDKGNAFKAFQKFKCSERLPVLLAAIQRDIRSQQWRNDSRYIPYPATWLNGRRWEDGPDDTPRRSGPNL